MNTDTNYIPRDERGNRIERNELTEGEEVIFEWSPYQWWSDHTGVSGRVKATVMSGPDIAGDITVGIDGAAMTLRDYGGSRRYVSGPSFEEDMPERTDIGMGARYYEVDK
jgi:hypothetical protein